MGFANAANVTLILLLQRLLMILTESHFAILCGPVHDLGWNMLEYQFGCLLHFIGNGCCMLLLVWVEYEY